MALAAIPFGLGIGLSSACSAVAARSSPCPCSSRSSTSHSGSGTAGGQYRRHHARPHMRKLVHADLVQVERRHKWAYYTVNADALKELTHG